MILIHFWIEDMIFDKHIWYTEKVLPARTTPYILILPYHIFLFSPVSGLFFHLQPEYHVLHFKLKQKCQVKQLFGQENFK